ncbi:GGDEF domain-containing protein [Acidihalobacter prosperus]|uniref:diguanylate cyclase n=1 Tax=Acidihalobacter prosperus TaxID=160660 RepID=A0A1A6C692_9GAMM|nr:GGDEF domain-containing protein [Acidihalobacter prosperus]OBS10081.1 HAMP domain-containing protein [Acidihalobacter prosperus]
MKMSAGLTLEHLLRRLSVGQRIAIMLALLLLPMAALSVVSLDVLEHQELDFRQSVQESINALLPLATLEHYLERAQVDELEAETDTSAPNFTALTHNIDRSFSTIETTDDGPDLPAGLITQAQRAWRDARPAVQRLVERIRPLRIGDPRLSDALSRKDIQQAIHDVSLARLHLAAVIKARYTHAIALRHRELRWLIWSWVVTLSVATVLIGLFLASILRPIKALETAARRLGAGESGVRVDMRGRDELTEVAERFNEMSENWETTRQALITETAMDPLTGVLNRRGILAALAAALNAHRMRDQGLSVFMMDLDRFKHINDTQGHSAGDRALVWVAGKMRECLRDSDHLGRYGGDEFLAILPGTGASQAQAIAQRMQRAIHDGASTDPSLPLVSIGIATAPDDGWDADTLIGAADAVLYTCKQRGREPEPPS